MEIVTMIQGLHSYITEFLKALRSGQGYSSEETLIYVVCEICVMYATTFSTGFR